MKTRWYKEAVIYQIYPRSFCDGNGDGIGDIAGIISKLDYLKDLGIDAIWLSPCYKSPNDDNGYDISDYRDIMDEFGTLDDWKMMMSEIHNRGMRLIMDLVANHTSDEHYWFKESQSAKDNPYRDYYIWREGKGNRPPNNWRSNFLGSAWEYNENTKEYYLHLFSKKQPDLNWDNPKVRQEIADICNYWFEMGVDGFRCDVITFISKNSTLPDGKDIFNPLRGSKEYILGENWKKYINEINQKSWSKYDSLIVGECAGIGYDDTVDITDENKNLIDTSFSFEHTYIDFLKKFKLRKLKDIFRKYQNSPEQCWNSNYLENHDQPRAVSRYGDDTIYRKQSATMLATCEFFLRGTPYIYQGQEIGMTNCSLDENEYKDIMSVNVIKTLNRFKMIKKFGMKILAKKARDNARTPMQWNGTVNAGFTDGIPWMKINPNYKEINVENDINSEFSIIEYYKKLIKVRSSVINIINNGSFTEFYQKSNSIYVFSRCLNNQTIYVECNFTDVEQRVVIPKNLSFTKSELLIANYDGVNQNLITHTLRPYETKVYILS